MESRRKLYLVELNNLKSNRRTRLSYDMTNLRSFCDNETGELIPYGVSEETGEKLISNHMVDYNLSEEKKNKPSIRFPCVSRTRKYQTLKANILAGSNTTSHRMLLLIPTFFPGIICVLLIIFEVFLHVRCHKKNKMLKEENVYYRSPFHVVTSMFCGVCRDNDMAIKIGYLQDKRRYHYDYLRGIAI